MRKLFLVLGIFAQMCILAGRTFGGTETSSRRSVPTFTLDQAILTSLQRNPDILRAEQEIKRTKGVIIEIRAQVLPHITAAGTFEWTDPNLVGARILGTTTGTSTGPATAAPSTAPALGAASTAPAIGTASGAASIIESPQSQVSTLADAALAAPSPTPGIVNIEQSDISYSISV